MNGGYSSKRLVFSLAAAVLLWSCGNGATEAASGPGTGSGRSLSGPYTHENLAVYLVRGGSASGSRTFVTLQEALARKQVVVHETGDVNQLAVENKSESDLYIQAGDIVKGGRQDRMISQDVIVPARSGKVPLASFCVEHGRWSRRGGETAVAFESSNEQVVGKALKLAARHKSDQSAVWKEVASGQENLARTLGAPVAAPASASSLQLTLENDTVKATAGAYLQALTSAPRGKRGAVGAAFVINGQVSSVEIYASHALFEKVWPKLLKAAAIEAITERGHGRAAASAAEVERWMAAAERAPGQDKDLSSRVKLVTRESSGSVLFETYDRERKDAWVHKSYVAK